MADFASEAQTHGPLALRTLRFIASYSRLQDNIRWLHGSWRLANPNSPDIVALNPRFGSIYDVDHPIVVLGVARLISSTARLENFGGIYIRAKNHRDYVAHAMFLNAMEHQGAPSFGMPHYHSDTRVRRLDGGHRGAARITDTTLERRERDIAWMLDQVQWVMDEAGWHGGAGRVTPPPTARPPASPPRHR